MALTLLFNLNCIAVNRHYLGQFRYIHRDYTVSNSVRNIPIWIEKSFGDSDRIAIDNAIKSWNYVLNGYIVLYVVDTDFDMEVSKIQEQQRKNGWLFMKIFSTNKFIPAYDTMAFCDKIGGNHLYVIRDRINNEDIYEIILHEISHLLGGIHNGEGLMHRYFNRIEFQCIDYDTAKQIANYNNISIDDMNYCIFN